MRWQSPMSPIHEQTPNSAADLNAVRLDTHYEGSSDRTSSPPLSHREDPLKLSCGGAEKNGFGMENEPERDVIASPSSEPQLEGAVSDVPRQLAKSLTLVDAFFLGHLPQGWDKMEKQKKRKEKESKVSTTSIFSFAKPWRRKSDQSLLDGGLENEDDSSLASTDRTESNSNLKAVVDGKAPLEPAEEPKQALTYNIWIEQWLPDQVRKCLEAQRSFVEAWKKTQQAMDDEDLNQDGTRPPRKSAWVCVSPTGLEVRSDLTTCDTARTGVMLHPGQMVLVQERKHIEGQAFLRLADGSGWAFVTKDGVNAMTEAVDVEVGGWRYKVICSKPVEIRSIPTYSDSGRTNWYLAPEESVAISVRCRLMGVRFLKLADGRGWVFENKPLRQQALSQLPAGGKLASMRSLQAFTWVSVMYEEPPDPADRLKVLEVGHWRYRVGDEPVPIIGSSEYGGSILRPGEIVEVSGRCAGACLVLTDGRGWVSEVIHGNPALWLKEEAQADTFGKRECAFVTCFIGLMALVVGLVATGALTDALISIRQLGIMAHVIVILILIFTAMPFGWGFTLVITLSGFIFGWVAVIPVEIGSLIGSQLSFYFCRNYAGLWVQTRMQKLSPRYRRILMGAEMAIQRGRGGILLQVALRVNPALTFGFTNAFLGISQVSNKVFFCSTALGIQSDVAVKTYVGVLLSEVGDFAGSTPETQRALQGHLIVQILVFFLLLLGGWLYTKWILQNVLAEEKQTAVSVQTSVGVC
eukprot:gnl/MRDRNA2_/MRDRNA2_72889_c0_seq1.p1 gnl/MRDRNA2_/MRDRNA2_72889_c0~~gnl/MRDRNA2_/MRDRNA2_72889_c0_seq1.p1  ORF type:complete len:750 (+),score=106.68 gnl/MRDRNA2_/MRDRNA2_72889_c0_seq1:74-2323(+)